MTCDRKNDQVHNDDNFILEYPNMLIFLKFLHCPSPCFIFLAVFLLASGRFRVVTEGNKEKEEKKKKLSISFQIGF